MAYGYMYEGDGFIRKGPVTEEVAGKEERVVVEAPKKAPKREERARSGVTPFSFARMVFGR